MTLAGTRPILQDELRQYELHHRARIAIKPGITGMWQVSGRSDITDFEEVVRLDTEYISNGQIVVDVAKGIEADTLYTMSEVIRDEIQKDGLHPNAKIVALSGPTHAEEVACDMPTTIVSACTDLDVAEKHIASHG